MKKGDILWSSIILAIIFVMVYPDTNVIYKQINMEHPYLIGFIKFMVLASMGEMLSIRIVNMEWKKPNGLILRGLIWGVIGVVIVMVFSIFPKGVLGTFFQQGLGTGMNIIFALITSIFLNVIFAPTMMAFHRITDTFIDLYYKENKMPKLDKVVNSIDWGNFVSFVILKTIPFFWIPAHTITFIIPSEYRVIVAAMLSVVLGGILAFAKKGDIDKIESSKINNKNNKNNIDNKISA